jgi:glycosyltransferase involved in cell wall biosynthesis
VDNSVTVSVTVPAYNAKDTIGRCLASLVSQDGVKLDIVVVHDGSTDGTSDLLDGFAARHDCVKVMHIENGGPSRARNAGLEASSGEYVAFCDADDWLDTGCLANAAEAAEGHSADVVVFGYKNIRARSTRTHAWCAERRMDAREFAERCLLDPRVQGFACNKLYSRELVALARFPEGVRVCEDLLFNLEIARRKEELVALCIPGATYNYDLTGESLTRGEDIYQAMRRVLLGLDDDAMAASVSRGALYAAAAKASLEMTRGGRGSMRRRPRVRSRLLPEPRVPRLGEAQSRRAALRGAGVRRPAHFGGVR